MSEHRWQPLRNGTFIIFGAGGATRNFLARTGSRPSAIVDNDYSKWGTTIEGISVQNPEAVRWDTITSVLIISVGYSEIREQLIRLGISPKAISTPPKAIFRSGALDSLECRVEAAKVINELNQHNLPDPVVCIYGTALGIVRDGDFIPWDHDLDLITSGASRPTVVKELNKIGRCIQDSDSTYICEMEIKGSAKLPISVEFYKQSEHVHRQSIFGKAWEWETAIFSSPESHVVHSMEVFVPFNSVFYLASIYGNNWNIPNPNFSSADYK